MEIYNLKELDTVMDEIDINGPAPETEPFRQYYFIKKNREYVKKKSEELGRPLTCSVNTFGCQMNVRDSEKLLGILEQMGYVKSDSENADFVIYNTCTVRENANRKVYGHLGILKHLKKSKPHMMIGLCGCMMQEQEVVETINKKYKFVDIVFGTHNVYKLAEIYHNRITSDSPVIDIWKDTDMVVEDLPAAREFPFKSGVNIMFGCNNFCTYCIVPYVRGRERSRTPEDIIDEIKALAADGVVEVMLLGQNVNSYGKNLKEPVTFAELLERVCQIDGIERVRFMTPHPKDLSDELIDVIARNPKVCRHIHLPLQSGSTRILKAMNRRYTKEDYLALVDKIKTRIPDVSITADIIVGFPGETEEDFLDTLDVVEKVRYDTAFTFIYSKRTGTPAAAMENGATKEEINDRYNRLFKRVQQISGEITQKFKGMTLPVLVEGISEQNNGLLTGRLSNNLLVHFEGCESLIGHIVDVKLVECKGFYFIGELEEARSEDSVTHKFTEVEV
ncbi:MAG: tRNA (N6-isopentenyl adenosine(37)-C2)-methylthiotransferase MiaB [Coprococcus sp.]|nr:tRNA (N6-isopentenyl adenosine(37)-C2)-methylthiotransferase MiaB [Coprococcus sp.]